MCFFDDLVGDPEQAQTYSHPIIDLACRSMYGSWGYAEDKTDSILGIIEKTGQA